MDVTFPPVPDDRADGTAALADLLLRHTSIFDLITRHYLLMAWACEQLARRRTIPDELFAQLNKDCSCRLPLTSPRYLSPPLICQILEESCPSPPPVPAKPLSGFFVSLEGGDGSGKSTQTKHLAQKLLDSGYDAIATRAIGGATGGGETLRAFILYPDYQWSPLAEALLTISIYRESFIRVIVPALQKDQIVICDRWIDTLLVYMRDDAAGITPNVIQKLYTLLVADFQRGFQPDLTFLLDIPYEIASERRLARDPGRPDRNEAKGEAFHRNVFDQLLTLAAKSSRFAIIDAAQETEKITDHLYKTVLTKKSSGRILYESIG